MNIEPTELLNALKHEPPQPDAPAKPIADKDALPRTESHGA